MLVAFDALAICFESKGGQGGQGGQAAKGGLNVKEQQKRVLPIERENPFSLPRIKLRGGGFSTLKQSQIPF